MVGWLKRFQPQNWLPWTSNFWLFSLKIKKVQHMLPIWSIWSCDQIIPQKLFLTHIISDSTRIPNTCFLSASQSPTVDYVPDSLNVFRIYPPWHNTIQQDAIYLNPWHSHRHSFLVSPVGATPVMELNTLKIILVGHPPNHLLPHLCRWQRWWGVIQ